MLRVATRVFPSKIHGMGCFAGEFIPAGAVVWVAEPVVDREVSHPGHLTPWERNHAYKSHTRPDVWILPRDNAGWINFSKTPNLIEGVLLDGEPVLMAAVDIHRGEELTVGVETDGDVEWKLRGNPLN